MPAEAYAERSFAVIDGLAVLLVTGDTGAWPAGRRSDSGLRDAGNRA
jgi:hypothetical protein